MVDQSLVDRKLKASFDLAARLTEAQAPLLAAYWEWRSENGRWQFFLVPRAASEERDLIKSATEVLIEPPYRSVFSLSDVFIDAHQIDRARAIGAYIRGSEDLGRQFDTTFTGGHYFESIIVVYVLPELYKAHYAA